MTSALSLARRARAPLFRGAALALGLGAFAAAGAGAQQIRTAAEASGFARHTTHAEMMEFLQAVKESSLDMRLGTYGTTRAGRELPYAILSRPLVSTPEEARMLGRPIVLLAANVHGGERTFREGLLPLLRELATRGTPENALLDELVILVAPQINPDGFHSGPIDPEVGFERGTRGTLWAPDLNRDYIKLEHPEILGYVGNLTNHWFPHIFVDGHNGGAQPYNLNYQCPSHAAPDQRLTEMCDFEIFPAIDAALEAEGLKSWYYQFGDETKWTPGGFEARIGRNYGGFTNAIGILFEAPGGQSLETGARAGYLGYRAVLQYAAQNAEKLTALIQEARMETIRMGLAAEGEVPVRMRYGPEPRTVQYELVRDGQIVQITSDSLMKRPIVLQTRERPYAYVLPWYAEEAVEMLRRHNIVVEQLTEPVELQVQAYTVGSVSYTSQYNHESAVVVDVGQVVNTEVEFVPGAFVVPTGQVLGRLVSHMLEVETEDNVIYWNTMDAWLPRPTAAEAPATQSTAFVATVDRGDLPLVPIFKLMEPTTLPTRLVP